MTRLTVALVAAGLAALAPARLAADVILTSENLNASLKSLLRLQRDRASDAADAEVRAQALFDLGVEADALSQLLSDEVAAHGNQEKQLLDLALRRTHEMGVEIHWAAAKERFFYDGDAFRRYLEQAPDGPRAAEAAFWLVETEFYETPQEDAEAMLAASRHKRAFLERHGDFELAPNVEVFLAIDYRDLYRLHRDAGRADQAARFAKLAGEQLKKVAAAHPDTETAQIAAGLQQRLDAELADAARGEHP